MAQTYRHDSCTDGRSGRRVLLSREVGDLKVRELVDPPRRPSPLHRHDRPDFVFLFGGFCSEMVGGEEHALEPHELLFKPGIQPHRNRTGDRGARYLRVEIGVPWLREAGVDAAELGYLRLRGARISVLAQRLAQEARGRGCASALAVQGLTLEVLAEVVRERDRRARPGRPPAWLTRARRHLDRHFQEPVVLEDLAARSGVHPSHLARTFRRFLGMTVGEYLGQRRLDYAAELLRDPSRPLATVALDAGFYDQSHFTNRFRDHTGLTPGRFRSALGSSPGSCKSDPTAAAPSKTS